MERYTPRTINLASSPSGTRTHSFCSTNRLSVNGLIELISMPAIYYSELSSPIPQHSPFHHRHFTRHIGCVRFVGLTWPNGGNPCSEFKPYSQLFCMSFHAEYM